MADTKQDVLDMLRELAELTLLEEQNPQSFRVRAYESAAQAIAAQATDLGKLTMKELQKIEGIGKSTAEKIRELLETGKVARVEALRQKHPRAVLALLQIQGLGPKAVARLRSASRAAAELCVTVSAISHRIRQLESHLGIRLFSRGDFTLTSDGAAYLQHVCTALAALLPNETFSPGTKPEPTIFTGVPPWVEPRAGVTPVTTGAPGAS